MLERNRIKRGEDGAQLIVARHAMHEGTEAAQEIELFLAEANDLGDGFRAAQHREEAKEEKLVQFVEHLRGLTGIRQVFEMTQEDDGFGDRGLVGGGLGHWRSPWENRRTATDSALYPFVTRIPQTRSPDCPDRHSSKPPPSACYDRRYRIGVLS